MAVAGCHAAARQDEILQCRKIGIEGIQLLFKTVDVVIENGRVIERGTHEELMGQRGAYKSFLRVCADGSRVPEENRA